MPTKARKYQIGWPLTADSAANIDEMFEDLYHLANSNDIDTVVSGFPDESKGSLLYISDSTGTVDGLPIGAAGKVVRSNGTLPVYSTFTAADTYAAGDIVHATSTNTLSGLADVATGNVLLSGGVGVVPAYGKVPLTTHISGILPVANGGTNLSSYTIGDLLYADGATSLAKLSDIATGNALISGGVGAAPTWGKINLSGAPTHVTGTLGLLRGGTSSDLSATGGTGRYFKQASAGAAVTVAQVDATELLNLLPYSSLTQATAASHLLGRGSAAGAGDWQDITLGASMSMAGTVLSAATQTSVLLDGSVHTDTVAQTVSRGSLVYGNSTPKWDELVVGSASTILYSNGTDAAWSAAPIVGTSITCPLLYGGSAANDDITIHGTSNATRTTSYVLLQPSGGLVGIGTSTPTANYLLHAESAADASTFVTSKNTNASGTSAVAVLRAEADTATVSFQAHGTGRVLTRWGVTLGGWAEFLQIGGSGLAIGTFGAFDTILGSHSVAILTLKTETWNVKLSGSTTPAVRGTTEGTNHLDIFDGTAPVGTLANGISIYSTAGECRVMDAAGNATLLSPHDAKTNEWIYHSKDPKGRVLRIDMERMMRFLNTHFGTDFIHEFEEVD